MLLKYILDPFNCSGKNKSGERKALPPTSDSFLLHCLWHSVDLISTVSVLLNTFKSVVLKPMGHNTVSHTVTHKYKSCVGYWVRYQKIAAESKGLNGRRRAHLPPLHSRRILVRAMSQIKMHAYLHGIEHPRGRASSYAKMWSEFTF